jgi:hypothetical protein
LSLPVHTDEREHSMLDFVPFARTWGIVADPNVQPDLIGQDLKKVLPTTGSATVASPSVSADQ